MHKVHNTGEMRYREPSIPDILPFIVAFVCHISPFIPKTI